MAYDAYSYWLGAKEQLEAVREKEKHSNFHSNYSWAYAWQEQMRHVQAQLTLAEVKLTEPWFDVKANYPMVVHTMKAEVHPSYKQFRRRVQLIYHSQYPMPDEICANCGYSYGRHVGKESWCPDAHRPSDFDLASYDRKLRGKS